MARRLVRGGTELRFVSAELRERFAALAGGAAGTVVPLAAPARLFPRRSGGPDPLARRHLGLRGPTLLAVGRLVPIKGHAALLRACALLEAERRRARSGRVGGGRRAEGWVGDRDDDVEVVEVVILGDGPERECLSRLALELGVRLRMPGFLARGEVSRWLSAADVYVQPSIRLANGRAEGAPLATAEARAVGIPIVVESDPACLAEALRNVTAV
jgi:glycosyltransferase involved in cell wall biosynthesis